MLARLRSRARRCAVTARRLAIVLARALRRFGFALLVFLAAIGAAYIAYRVQVPEPVPSFALQAAPVYRLEIGIACFAGFYLGIVSVVLALNGRGFIKLGSTGVEAQSIVDHAQQDTARKHASALRQLGRGTAAIQAAMAETEERINRLEQGLKPQTPKDVE